MKPLVALLAVLSVVAIVLAISRGALDKNAPQPALPDPQLLAPDSR